MTEVSKAPPRAVALASYLGEGYSAIGRAPSAKDLMAFGSVLQAQHNIGKNANWMCFLGLRHGKFKRHVFYLLLPLKCLSSQSGFFDNLSKLQSIDCFKCLSHSFYIYQTFYHSNHIGIRQFNCLLDPLFNMTHLLKVSNEYIEAIRNIEHLPLAEILWCRLSVLKLV